MDGTLSRIMASMALVFMCSCAAKTYTHEDRQYCTGISADEGVVILLDSFSSHDKSIESEGEEKSLGNCIRDGMRKADSKIETISAKDFRRTVFPNKEFLDSPRSSKHLLSFLRNPDAQSRVRGLGVRYLIILSARTQESEKVWTESGGGGGSGGGGTFARESTRSSDITADVLDVTYLRESGSVTASSSGKCGWGVACCWMCGFPPCAAAVPYCYFARTETEACSALGEAVMRFLIDGREMVPTPELGTGIDSKGKGSDIQSDIQTAPPPASGDELPTLPQEPERYDKDSQN